MALGEALAWGFGGLASVWVVGFVWGLGIGFVRRIRDVA